MALNGINSEKLIRHQVRSNAAPQISSDILMDLSSKHSLGLPVEKQVTKPKTG